MSKNNGPSIPRHGELAMKSFKVRAGGTSRTVKVPVSWDAEAGSWMMTPEGIGLAEKTKLLLTFDGWLRECDWPATKSDTARVLRLLSSRLLALVECTRTTRAHSPSRLGVLAHRLASASDPSEVCALRAEIERGFYGRPLPNP